MARKKSIDELDEEMERLEAELRALEEGGSLPDEDEPVPRGEGKRKNLLGRLKRDKRDDVDEDAVEASDTQDPADDEPGEKKGLLGRLKREKDAREDTDDPTDTATDEAQSDEPTRSKLLGRFKREKDTPDEGGPDATDQDDEDAAEADEAAPAKKSPRSLFGRKGGDPADAGAEPEGAEDGPDEHEDHDERDAPPPAAPAPEPEPASEHAPAARARAPPPPGAPEKWERTEEGWRRRSEKDAAAARKEAEKAERTPKAKALLARFRRGEDDDEDEAVAAPLPGAPGHGTLADDEPEEDRRRKGGLLWLWILLALVGIVLIAVVAAYVLGDGNGGFGDRGNGGSGGLAASFTLANALPGGDLPIAVTNEPAEFDAGASTGSIDEYRWDFGDGRTATTDGPTTTHFYSERGEKTVTLTVVADGNEQTSTQNVMVVLQPSAVPVILIDGSPVASPGSVGNNAFTGEPVTLDGTGSTGDSDHPIVEYAWDVDDDGEPDATGETTEFTFTEQGMYMVFLTVTDELGNSDRANFMVHVAGRLVEEGVAPASIPTETTQEHPFQVDTGRQMTTPVQVTATLTYEPPAFGVQPDLDLVLVDADGNEFTASDDGGSGSESITLTAGDLAARGQWTARIVHPAGDTNEIPYTVVLEVYH